MQLNYHGYCNATGYSIACQENILALLRVNPDIDIRLHYVNRLIGEGISDNRKQILTSLHHKEATEPNVNLYHTIPARYRRPPGKTKHFGYCVFETINLPQDWVETMNNMDGIITASEFNKNIFESSGVDVPISIVPHCFDTKMFNRSVNHTGRYKDTTFISMGAWKERKNWSLLIRSWYEAFELRDNVCLLIKTDKPKDLKVLVSAIKSTEKWKSKNTAPIYCEENPLCNFEDIPKLLKKGDIYISTSLGEGFGYGGLHAMALGIPVITTRFGGSLEYAKPELCTYLEPKKYVRQAVMDNIPQLSNCIWPLLDVTEVSTKMRYVLSNIQERENKSFRAYDFVHENFCYENIGKKLISSLELD